MLEWQAGILAGSAVVAGTAAFLLDRQRRVRNLKWPKTAAPIRFVNLCSSYLTSAGWLIKDRTDYPGDLVATKDGVETFFICRASGSPVGPAFLAEMASVEIRYQKPIVIVVRDEPDEILRAQAAEVAAGLIHYSDLRDLDSFVATRLVRWGAKSTETSDAIEFPPRPEAPSTPPHAVKEDSMLTENEVYAALNEIFRDVFNRDDLTLTPQLTARDVPGWDSFKQIEIIMAAEERFGIRFSSREIDGLNNVGDLSGIIRKKCP